MLKNITLSAEERLIEAARERALQERTTLNAEFREWLKQYSSASNRNKTQVEEYHEFMEKVRPYVTIGKKLTREDMNER